MSSVDPDDQKEPDAGGQAPSADDIDDPGLQAEIANPADSNQPTGADAAPEEGTTAADDEPVPAPGAPGELSSDQTPSQGQERGDSASPAADDVAQVPGGDAGSPDTTAPAETPPTAGAPAPATESAVVPEQPPPTPTAAVRGAAAEQSGADKAARADEAAEVADSAETPEVEVDEAAGGMLDTLRSFLGDDLEETHVAHGREVWARVSVEAWRRTAEVCRDELGLTYFCFLSAIDWMPSPYGRSEEPVAGDDNGEGGQQGGGGESPAALEHGYAGGQTRFQLLARLMAPVTSVGVILKVDLPDDDLRAPSWVRVYAGADWHEREVWEMYGITFDGHPNLVHLYLPGAFEGNPLRKDFPLLAREVKPWPGLVDVEAMPGEGDGS